jgi:hypothetical protein
VAIRVRCHVCTSVDWCSLGCGSFAHWNVYASVGWRSLGCGSLAQTYTHEVTGSTTVTNNSPPLFSTTKVDDTERVNRDVIFLLDIRAEKNSTVSSHISTEMFDNYEALCRMDAEFLSSNLNPIVLLISLCPRTFIPLLCNQTRLASVMFYLDNMNWT